MKKSLYVFIAILILSAGSISHADGIHSKGISVDGTLGTAGKLDLPGPDYEIKAEYGAQSGANLFHSFQQFNLHKGESATFTGPDSVKNIISRVTGGDASWIDGRIASAVPNADLYFLNPAGVMFGPDVSLNIGGSFHVSTADYLRMSDNERFYSMPSQGEIFSSAEPAAFGFLDSNISPITMEGKGEITQAESGTISPGLRVSEGKSISLIGGDIEMSSGTHYNLLKTDEKGEIIYKKAVDEKGNMIKDEQGKYMNALDENGNSIPLINTVKLGDMNAGRINLVSLGSEGEAEIRDSDIVCKASDMGRITIADNMLLDVSGEGAGNIFIRGGQFTLNNSELSVRTLGSKDGGVTDIQSDSISFANGGVINSDTEGSGKGADIRILAEKTVSFAGERDPRGIKSDPSLLSEKSSEFAGKSEEGNPSGIQKQSLGENGGDSGNILISAENISLGYKGKIFTGTSGTGRGADVTLKADETISFGSDTQSDGGAIRLITRSADEGAGNAGNLVMEAKNIFLHDKATIRSDTYGNGHGGDIRLTASESLDLRSSFLYLTVGENAAGNAGNFLLQGENMLLSGGTFVNSVTSGKGNAGNVSFNASKSFTLQNNSSILFAVAGTGIGKGGDLIINAENVSLSGKSFVNSGTYGQGDGGNIRIRGSESVVSSDTSVLAGTAGNYAFPSAGGTISIETKDLSLNDGTVISTSSSRSGRGGDINLMASESLSLSGTNDKGLASKVFSSTLGAQEGAGDAGNILIESGSLSLRDGACIAAGTSGPGNGGLITIRADNAVEMGGANPYGENENGFASEIYTRSSGKDETSGNAGDISIWAGSLSLSDGAWITGSVSGGGKGGLIDIAVNSKVRISGDSSGIELKEPLKSQSDFQKKNSPENFSVSGIYSRSESPETFGGDAGEIRLSASDLFLSAKGNISTSAEGGGNAGTVAVHATDAVKIEDNAAITTEAVGAGGGRIILEAGNLLYISDAEMTTSVKDGAGNGGDITVGNPRFVILNDSRLRANAYEGAGGNIRVTAQHFIQSGTALLEASSEKGIDGSVEIESPQSDVSSELTALPLNFIDARQWLRSPCSENSGEKTSRFMVIGPDAAANPFDDLRASPPVEVRGSR
jgi:filamentous hemagglutinin family protein